MRRLHLANDVHAVAIGQDLVFLDVAADAYFCLVDGGQGLVLEPDGVVRIKPAAGQGAAQLLEAGLLAPEPGRTARPSPMRVERALVPSTTPAGLNRWVSALKANHQAADSVRRRDMKGLLALVATDDAALGRPPAFAEPSDDLLAEAASFRRLAPWLPRGGVCLMRSLQLRLHLMAQGLRPAWVFGVRTWPFEAHCWLQAGNVVLDDELERVRAFHPIMVV